MNGKKAFGRRDGLETPWPDRPGRHTEDYSRLCGIRPQGRFFLGGRRTLGRM